MPNVSVAHLFIRLVLSMVVVLGLLALAARFARRRVNGGSGRSRGAATRTSIEVVARQQLSRGSALTVVRTGDRLLVLGVTDTSVTLLRDGEAGGLEPPVEDLPYRSPRTATPGASRPTSPWMSVIETLRERTVRRR